jgi:signal transduction histidine kinase/CheY-like chemotaxis protein
MGWLQSVAWRGLNEREGISAEYVQRLGFGWLMLLFVGPFFYGYFVYFLLKGLFIASGLMLFGAVSITASIILYLTPVRNKIGVRGFKVIVVVGVLLPLILHDIDIIWVNGRLEYFAWIFLYPPLAFFLLGQKGGLILMGIVGAVGGILLANPLHQKGMEALDSKALTLQGALALVSTILISLFYEMTRRQTMDRLIESGTQLRKASDELEARVSERTAELLDANYRLSRTVAERQELEQQLLRAQKLESVAILAGGVAHDFNNILQIISGHIDLLSAKTKDVNDDASILQTIKVAIDRATLLTQQLLLFGRRQGSNLLPVDINVHVTDTSQILERTIPRMISVETRLARDLKSVRADASQIQQLIMNLSLNARDAMPMGGRLLFVTTNIVVDETFAGTPPGEYVQLSVADTGTGMDRDTLQSIYDPFFTTKERGKGTGLGLAVVYGIIANHQGHIFCSSEPGKGTIFTMLFPVAGPPQEVVSAPARRERAMQGGSEKILVVDDDGDVLRWERVVLSRKGYAIVTASTGEEAIRRFKEESPELVILDLNMPGMGGYRCFQELSQVDAEIKVIIASGHSSEVLPQDLLDQGAQAVLTKPFTEESLLRQTREVLDRSHGTRA